MPAAPIMPRSRDRGGSHDVQSRQCQSHAKPSGSDVTL
jgi:hypothetical protein